MNKILNFLKKNYFFSIIGAAVLLVIIITLIVFVKRGTFGLDNNNLTIECSKMVDTVEGIPNTGNVYQCAIHLHYDDTVYNGNKKILSVNANYAFSTGISYAGFLPKCPVASATECDVAEYTENGFAIGDLDGFQNDSLTGTLFVTVDDSLTNATLTVGLTNIEFSDSDYQMLSVSNANGTIVIGNGGTVQPIDDITFASDLGIDEDNKIVYNITLGTTYGELKEKITTDFEYTLYDSDNNLVHASENDFVLETGSKLVFVTREGNSQTSTNVTYRLAVLDDFNGDGKLKLSDLSTLFQLYESDNNEPIYRYVGKFSLVNPEIKISEVSGFCLHYEEVE